jgi:hypothetical protein
MWKREGPTQHLSVKTQQIHEARSTGDILTPFLQYTTSRQDTGSCPWQSCKLDCQDGISPGTIATATTAMMTNRAGFCAEKDTAQVTSPACHVLQQKAKFFLSRKTPSQISDKVQFGG